MTLAEKLRALNAMLEELKDATDDRFSDLNELGHAIARLASGNDLTVRRLGSITAYLAQDGGVDILGKIDEVSGRIDTLIKEAEGKSQ
jgi:altronate dehydratase